MRVYHRMLKCLNISVPRFISYPSATHPSPHCLVFMGFPTFLNFYCAFDLLVLILGYLIFYILPFMTYALLDTNLHAPLLCSPSHFLLYSLCSVLSRRSPRTILKSMSELLNPWWWCQWVEIWGCEVIFGWPLSDWILRDLGGRYILPDRTWIFFLGGVRYHWVLPVDPLKLIIPQLGVPGPHW